MYDTQVINTFVPDLSILEARKEQRVEWKQSCLVLFELRFNANFKLVYNLMNMNI